MKKMFTIVSCCLLSAAAFASTHVPGNAAPAGREQGSAVISARPKAAHEAVVVCHKGRALTVDANAVPAHLAHGDRLGSCVATPGTPGVAESR